MNACHRDSKRESVRRETMRREREREHAHAREREKGGE